MKTKKIKILIPTSVGIYKYNPTNDNLILKFFPENMHYTHLWKIVMEIIGWDIETDCYFTTPRIRKRNFIYN
jgi:hypothetical protein